MGQGIDLIQYMKDTDLEIKSVTATGEVGFVATTKVKDYLSSTNMGNNKNSGFDRVAMELEDDKALGIIEYCLNAASGIYWRIDYDGTPSKHTSETTFGDGTALADRTLVQYKCSGETNFNYWYTGDNIEVTTTKSLQLAVDAVVYVYYDSTGNMNVISQSGRRLIMKETLIAFIDDTTTFGCDPYFADERHGIDMDGQTHLRMHMVDKFRVVAHGEIVGLANNVKTFTSISEGLLGDEDIPMFIDAKSALPKMYKIGANWGTSNTDTNLALLDGGITQVNEITAGVGTLTDLLGNDRLSAVIIACNDSINPLRIMVGQTAYANRGEARDHIRSEWERLDLGGLPSPEMTAYFTVIVDKDGALETGLDGEIYVVNKNDVIIPMFS